MRSRARACITTDRNRGRAGTRSRLVYGGQIAATRKRVAARAQRACRHVRSVTVSRKQAVV